MNQFKRYVVFWMSQTISQLGSAMTSYGFMNAFQSPAASVALGRIVPKEKLACVSGMNTFSRLTYENVLSPMILFRSGNNSLALGVVNAMMGVGGILGDIIVSTGKLSKDPIKMIYASAALSFLFGDLLMGFGQSTIL